MRPRLALALPCWLLLSGCDMAAIGTTATITGSGVPKDEKRVLAPFTKVEVSAMFEATVASGPDRSVSLQVDDNLLPLIRTRVVDGRLTIDFIDGTIIVTSRPQKVAIVAPDLVEIIARGAAKVLADGVTGESFRVKSEAASSIELKRLDVRSLDVEASGAGRVTLQGRGKALTLDASGSSKLRAMDATFEAADVMISGASRCELGVTGSIAGEINGASSLDVVGSPPNRLVKAFGAARVGY